MGTRSKYIYILEQTKNRKFGRLTGLSFAHTFTYILHIDRNIQFKHKN